jgi:hypothetical protein
MKKPAGFPIIEVPILNKDSITGGYSRSTCSFDYMLCPVSRYFGMSILTKLDGELVRVKVTRCYLSDGSKIIINMPYSDFKNIIDPFIEYATEFDEEEE